VRNLKTTHNNQSTENGRQKLTRSTYDTVFASAV
jgi:hypothetical protein